MKFKKIIYTSSLALLMSNNLFANCPTLDSNTARLLVIQYRNHNQLSFQGWQINEHDVIALSEIPTDAAHVISNVTLEEQEEHACKFKVKLVNGDSHELALEKNK